MHRGSPVLRDSPDLPDKLDIRDRPGPSVNVDLQVRWVSQETTVNRASLATRAALDRLVRAVTEACRDPLVSQAFPAKMGRWAILDLPEILDRKDHLVEKE